MDSTSDPLPWAALVSKLASVATEARTQDTNKLREQTTLLVQPHGKMIHPALSTDAKSDRGLSHPALRLELMGCKHRQHLPFDVYAGPDPNNASIVLLPDLENVVLSAKGTELLGQLNDGTYAYKTCVFPSAFYPAEAYAPGVYDIKQPWVGLFTGPLFVRVARFLFTGPGSAWKGFSGALPDARSVARLCNVWKITPRMVGYVACQLRTMLSKSDWAAKDGKYDYEKLFKMVVELFDQPHLQDWGRQTLGFLQQEVYRDAVAPEVDPNAGADEDDSDDEFAACRRAPSAPSPTPE
ncbi:hypothetical protein C8F01DRAFT_1174407 [Mycena amicta]|nr:hypothetical protein C8F01DRAFT_1174407 [Mycena amicta]